MHTQPVMNIPHLYVLSYLVLFKQLVWFQKYWRPFVCFSNKSILMPLPIDETIQEHSFHNKGLYLLYCECIHVSSLYSLCHEAHLKSIKRNKQQGQTSHGEAQSLIKGHLYKLVLRHPLKSLNNIEDIGRLLQILRATTTKAHRPNDLTK